MEQGLTNGQAFCLEYGQDIQNLSRYIPWLMEKKGRDVSSEYAGEYGNSQLKFPVYDSTLMTFVREAGKTRLMDKNYAYAYTRYKIKTNEDEKKAILNAGIKDIDLLKGVFTKYISEGMRKSGKWQEAIERQVFLDILQKLNDLLVYYNGQLENQNGN